MILKHYWKPIREVEKHVERACGQAQHVLDIGASPAHTFGPATTTVGWDGDVKRDLERSALELAASFVYCRHTIEDLANPEHLLSEIATLGCDGYIETPSPLAELTRGVDAWLAPHRGYLHHRWLVWSHEGVLYLLPKYPIVELTPEFDCTAELNQGPQCWNTHHLWEGRLKYKVLRNEQDFKMSDLRLAWFGPTPIQYTNLLQQAQEQYRVSNAAFWKSLSLTPATAAA